MILLKEFEENEDSKLVRESSHHRGCCETAQLGECWPNTQKAPASHRITLGHSGIHLSSQKTGPSRQEDQKFKVIISPMTA